MAAVVDVAVGVVTRADGAVLIGQRVAGKPYAGWWEFPGGKLEPGETVAQALARELHEEIGIGDVRSQPWVVLGHVYPHATVRLHFRRVVGWTGEPRPREGQALVWQHPDAITVAPLLPAAIAPIGWLRLPPLYAISCAGELGVEAFERALDRRLGALAAAGGPRTLLLQLREPQLGERDLERLFAGLRERRARGALRLLVSSRHPRSFAAAADGVHLTEADLRAATSRPPHRLVGASCHDREGLAAAARVGCDLAVLGPVLPTASHPGAPTLGWERLAAALDDAPLPVYALGGLSEADLGAARAAGAHGVAAMRSVWR